MKALVLGGTGFIGLNIVEALIARGHVVRASRRRRSNTIFLRRLGVPMCWAELSDRASLRAAMEGVDTVFFAAGRYPHLASDPDREVALARAEARNVVQAARLRGIRRLVYTSSVATIGRPRPGRLARESDGRPASSQESTYIAVKLALEREVLAARGDGMELVVLCPTGCVGPYDHKLGTGFFLVALANGVLDRYVEGQINIVDARDVAQAHLAAARQGRPGERYIVGGHNTTAGELLGLAAAQLGRAADCRPVSAARALAEAAAEEARIASGDPRRRVLAREIVEVVTHGQHVDATRMRDELGICPRPLAETLRCAIQWYRRNGFIQTSSEEVNRACDQRATR